MIDLDIASALTEGRAYAEARFSDACIITTPDGTPVWNPTTEVYDVDAGATIYTGGCRVKMPNAMSLEPDAGATEHVVLRPSVHIPADVEGVEVGNAVTITAATFNPSLDGAVFRVTSLFRDSQATAQRLECTEVLA